MDGTAAHPSPREIPGGEIRRLSAGWTLARAAEALASCPLPLLPVTDGAGRLEGVLSRGDLEAFLRDASLQERVPPEEALRRFAVGDAMERRPVTALPGDSPGEAAALLSRYALPALAVTDGEGRFLALLLPRATVP